MRLVTADLADPAVLRAVAVSVARPVGELAVRMRTEAVGDVGTKTSETDVVTAGDMAAERLARRLLAQYRPGDPVLGEEEGGEAPPPGTVCWIVDPIDGTVNYLYGFPWYAVSVAAQRDGVSLAGAVVHPPSGRVWSAATGLGAECDGQPLRVTAATVLAHSLIGTGFAYQAQRRTRQAALVAGMLPQVRDVRRAGSAALDLCSVASGWLDGYVEHGLQRWDWAAGALIAAEAGAVVRLPGAPADGLGDDATLAAGPGIATALAGLLADQGAAGV
ncbi:MAG: inositol monophosphatase [Pseudonocardiaceae bacterium]|nr:inositol monophosphatase [Pseudonocardiaceae bacterium]